MGSVPSDLRNRLQKEKIVQRFVVTITWASVRGERANLTMLVLFCIKASDSESTRIFQH